MIGRSRAAAGTTSWRCITLPPATARPTFEYRGCGEGDPCPLDLVWNEVECNQFALEAVGQPEGATLVWTLDGEFYDYLTPEIVFV